MLRVAVIADSHFDEGSRFEECVRLHEWIARDVASRGVDVIVHAGDIFERKSTPAERRAVAEWLGCCADIAPVLIVRGNHDAVGDLAIFARLRTKHPVIVEEACGVHVLENRACPGCGRLQRIEGEGEAGQGGVRRCVDDGAGAGCGREWRRRAVAVGAFAWPRKAELLEIDCAGPELTELVNDLLRSCVGPRWTVSIEATRLSADGKRELEGCEVRVLDTVKGREAAAETFSAGERVLLGEAVSLALSMIACRRAGVDGPTLIRDESGAALDPDNARAYVAMLRRAAEIVGASKVLFVSHSPEVQELADARIAIRDGRIVEVG